MAPGFADYYDQEIRYVTEAAHEFAEKHPERAAFLRLESKDRDPYVERLLEGFAFITARTRQKLDDEYPEFTRGLLEILLPHYLRPVPSMAMLQFLARRGALQESQILRRGTYVYGPPTGPEGVSCRFTTTSDVRLNPIVLEQALLERTPQGRHLLRLKFTFERGVDPRRLTLDPLSIFLHGEPTLTGSLHLFLTRHTDQVWIRPAGGEPRVLGSAASPPIQPAGFAEEEALIPYALRSFPGYRYLQEYFAFRERFLGIQVRGVEAPLFEVTTKGFDLECRFAREYPEEKRFAADQFRLHCTPIVNLFPMDTEPVRTERERAEFRVVPDARYPTGIEVYAVDGVVEKGERGVQAYDPFYSFSPRGGDASASSRGSFVATQQLGETGRWQTILRVNRAGGDALDSDRGALSIEAWCTNGHLPHDLSERSIQVPGPDFPEYAHFTNLTRPTLPAYPPQGQELEWRLVAHLALNHSSLSTASALRSLLQLYDWGGAPANSRRIAGIRGLSVEPRERLVRGIPIRGSHLVLELEEDHYLDRADAYLFGLVLSRFFQLYATVNSFIHVTVKLAPSGEQYEWTPSQGQLTLI